MKNVMLIFIGIVTIIACSNDRDSLNDIISKMNKNMPKQEKNWTMDSMSVSNKGEIVYYCNTDKNASYFNLLKNKKDSITDALIAKLNDGELEKSMELVKLCKKYDAGIVYKYSSKNTNEKLIIKIPLEKLIVDPGKE